MTFEAPPSRARRRALRPLLAAAGLLLASSAHGEPLFLRIRALPEPGSVGAARAAREAVWARSEARAHAAIASVCTGCLGAWRRPVALAAAAPPTRADEPVATPVAMPAASTGLEPDPASGASDTPTQQPIREERP